MAEDERRNGRSADNGPQAGGPAQAYWHTLVRDRLGSIVLIALALTAQLLGPEWVLPWKTGYDWAPWDLKHRSTKAKIEIRQAAARQSWHTCEDFEAKPPKFDIAPRKGYWTRDNEWISKPGRHAHIYIFAWHPETKKSLADHHTPEQWLFYVLPTKCLPPGQRSIALSRIECRCARKVRSDSLTQIVEELHGSLSEGAQTKS